MQSPSSNCYHLGDLAGYTNRPSLHTASGTDARRMSRRGRDPRPHREATQYAAVGEHPVPQTAAASQGRTGEVSHEALVRHARGYRGIPPHAPRDARGARVARHGTGQ